LLGRLGKLLGILKEYPANLEKGWHGEIFFAGGPPLRGACQTCHVVCSLERDNRKEMSSYLVIYLYISIIYIIKENKHLTPECPLIFYIYRFYMGFSLVFLEYSYISLCFFLFLVELICP